MGFLDRFKSANRKEDRPATPTAASPSQPEASMPAMPEIVEITTNEFAGELEQGNDILVVDVRMPWDYQVSHIPGAISIPLATLPQRYSELPTDRDIVLYCYHGFSSQDGTAFLMQRGYTRVRSLIGGFTQWAAEGRPSTSE